MAQVVALRHVAFEGPGLIGEVAATRGHLVEVVDVPGLSLATLRSVADDADLLVVLGGPVGSADDAVHPWLTVERELLAARLAEDRPTLGVCLGAQLLAEAAGGAVGPGAVEIGWSPMQLTAAGHAGPLAALAPAPQTPTTVPVLHWHGDHVTPPPRATVLATTPACACQAFALGARQLGLQAHLEAGHDGLEPWFVGHHAELRQHGLDVPTLRAATAEAGPPLAPRAARALDAWLATAGL